MSAFICHPDHISNLAHALAAFDVSPMGADRLAEILANANAASVGVRYRMTPDEAVQDFFGVPLDEYIELCQKAPRAYRLGVVDLLKMAQCFDYQACEIDDYDDTQAAALMSRLRSACIARLPGYDAAPWEFINTEATDR